MREAFTKTLRHVIQLAQREARELNQEFVGTEHLFLGVTGCHDCEVEHVLQQQHMDARTIRAAVLSRLPRGDEPPVILGDLPLTPKAQRAVNGAIVKAQALREPRISTRFLMLSLIDEPHTLVREALGSGSGEINQLRHALVELPVDAEE